MDETVKTNWVAALNSGEYKQGTGCLNPGDGMCCLGVLTDLYAKEKGLKWVPRILGPGSDFYVDGLEAKETGLTPKEVILWSGVGHRSPSIPVITRETYKFFENVQIDIDDIDYHANLSELNDSGFTFSQIADLIKAFL